MDPRDKNLWHVVLTPAGVEVCEPLDASALAGLPLEVCHMEPVGPERAQQLIELFAMVSAGQAGAHEHGRAFEGPCPICSPLQRDLVADAVRRAMGGGAGESEA